MRPPLIAVSAIFVAVSVACKSTTAPTPPVYNPSLPTSWAANVTNQYFPLTPGTTFRFKGQKANAIATITVEVLPDRRVIKGVVTTAVRDRVYLNGELIEDTFDWYGQDSNGNVWYLGESVKDYTNGVLTSTEGSWEWGVDGALPGIAMWASPAGQYREQLPAGVLSGTRRRLGEDKVGRRGRRDSVRQHDQLHHDRGMDSTQAE